MADTPKDEFRKLMRAYAGFQMATALVLSAKAPAGCCVAVVVSLFAVSIPSTVAYAGFARLTPEDEKRNPAHITFICGCLAFIPSLAALSLLLAAASIFAAIAFPVTCAAWFVVIIWRVRTSRHNVKSSSHDAEPCAEANPTIASRFHFEPFSGRVADELGSFGAFTHSCGAE